VFDVQFAWSSALLFVSPFVSLLFYVVAPAYLLLL
jgi:hypothetical protein